MIDVRSVEQVRAAEERAFQATAEGALMQRAATGLAVTVASLLRQARGLVVGSRVVLLVGSGNNGGDALWAGAMLAGRGCRVTAVTLSERWHAEGAGALTRAGGSVLAWDPGDARLLDEIARADVAVDGILGIGGAGALRPDAEALVGAVATSDAFVVAVDVPSGVDADSGVVAGGAVHADVTVTFGAIKPGLVVEPGMVHCGSTVLIDIGLEFEDGPVASVMEALDVARWVPEPAQDDYKYSRGVVGVAAGSRAYPGAALLAAAAARHGNVGMTRFLDRSDGAARLVVERFPDVVVDGTAPADQPRATAWTCGPGFPGDVDDEVTVSEVLKSPVPVVLDAGALTVIADSAAVRTQIAGRDDRVTVITPHQGEFERIFPGLLAASTGRLAAARSAARNLGAVVVLKGPGTVIAAPDGTAFIDTEGTSDLGAAGSGDVLSGLIGALLAGAWAGGLRSTDDLTEATAAAVWLHGRAGRLAAEHGPVVSTDVADNVPRAIRAARFGEGAR